MGTGRGDAGADVRYSRRSGVAEARDPVPHHGAGHGDRRRAGAVDAVAVGVAARHIAGHGDRRRHEAAVDPTRIIASPPSHRAVDNQRPRRADIHPIRPGGIITIKQAAGDGVVDRDLAGSTQGNAVFIRPIAPFDFRRQRRGVRAGQAHRDRADIRRIAHDALRGIRTRQRHAVRQRERPPAGIGHLGDGVISIDRNGVAVGNQGICRRRRLVAAAAVRGGIPGNRRPVAGTLRVQGGHVKCPWRSQRPARWRETPARTPRHPGRSPPP